MGDYLELPNSCQHSSVGRASKAADEIFVMRDGQIVERGIHADLMLRQGFNAKLISYQSGQRDVAVRDTAVSV